MHFDVFSGRAGFIEAALPRDDAVGARVDRGRRHRWRRAQLLVHHRIVCRLAAEEFIDAPRIRRLRMSGKGCGEGHDAARVIRQLLGHLACVEPSEAPADQADRLAVALGQRFDIGGATAQHAAARSEVETLAPGLRDVAEAAQETAQRNRRQVVRAHAREHHHRVTVAARQPTQPGHRCQQRKALEWRPALEGHQQGTGCPDGAMRCGAERTRGRGSRCHSGGRRWRSAMVPSERCFAQRTCP